MQATIGTKYTSYTRSFNSIATKEKRYDGGKRSVEKIDISDNIISYVHGDTN